MLRHALEAHGHAVLEARDEPEAIRELRRTRPVVVLTDLRLPVGDGFGVLRAAKELDPDLPVVVMTAYGSIQDAVSAMREGAMDFLAKPVEPDHLLLMVERAIAQRRILTEYIVLKEELAERRGAPRIIGEDGKLRQVSQQLHRAAATDATVLLEGESGTGKELFARALHALSPRADGPFVAINCAAIPESLLESELFGYEPGAFTDARAQKIGLIELADGGTLFLDEITEIDPVTQAKLLKFLDTKRFRRLGGDREISVETRVIAASNREIKDEVRVGRFREDLYYRLNVVEIRIPALRERREDVETIANHYFEAFKKKFGKPELVMAPAARTMIRDYPWPGNVRELVNVLERAVLLSKDDAIEPHHLPIEMPASGRRAVLQRREGGRIEMELPTGTVTLDEVERALIEATLKRTRGNVSRAADLMGTSRGALRNKLTRYKIDSRAFHRPSFALQD